jgi:hypothetical protein
MEDNANLYDQGIVQTKLPVPEGQYRREDGELATFGSQDNIRQPTAYEDMTPEEQAQEAQYQDYMENRASRKYKRQERRRGQQAYGGEQFFLGGNNPNRLLEERQGTRVGNALRAGKNVLKQLPNFAPGIAAVGNMINEPDWQQQMEDSLTADNVFNTVRPEDYGHVRFDPYAGTGKPQQTMGANFTGMNQNSAQFSRYGGPSYEMGGEYDLSQEEIDYIQANGGEIEYLD